jgi:hypothetical protein
MLSIGFLISGVQVIKFEVSDIGRSAGKISKSDPIKKRSLTCPLNRTGWLGIVDCRRVPRARAGYTRGGRRVRRARVRRVDGYGGHG